MFAENGQFYYATNLDGFRLIHTQTFSIEAKKLVEAFKEKSTATYIDCKGKSTIGCVKRWVKENKPKVYFAEWLKDTPYHKEDSVKIHYIEVE